MKELLSYLEHKPIDCQVNLFGKNGLQDYGLRNESNIVMIENFLKYDNTSLAPYFDKFIDKIDHKNYILCVGNDLVDTENIYKKYNCFSGFGEVKCYKHYIDSQNKEREQFDDSILKGVLKYKKPIFIHWDLNGKHDDDFFDIVKNNPDIIFVLCHCGLNELDNQDNAFDKSIELQYRLPNLWLNISWTALDYLYKNRTRIAEIEIPDHVLVGTDFSSEMLEQGKSIKDIYHKFLIINKFFNVKENIHNLFV